MAKTWPRLATVPVGLRMIAGIRLSIAGETAGAMSRDGAGVVGSRVASGIETVGTFGTGAPGPPGRQYGGIVVMYCVVVAVGA